MAGSASNSIGDDGGPDAIGDNIANTTLNTVNTVNDGIYSYINYSTVSPTPAINYNDYPISNVTYDFLLWYGNYSY